MRWLSAIAALCVVFALGLAKSAPAGENADAKADEKAAGPAINLQGSSPAELMYGVIMANFANRSLDGMAKSIEATIETAEKGDPVRLRLAMALAKLGKPEAEKALDYLVAWHGDFKPEDEAIRICNVADLYLYYLDEPEQAVKFYRAAVERIPELRPHLYSSLFSVYANHKKMFSIPEMKKYLNLQGELDSSFRYYINRATALAADGYTFEARKYAEYIEERTKEDEDAIGRTYAAPIWGWLGEVAKTVEFLEAGLKEQALFYSPAGFRLYCDWLRQSPAYDPVREDKEFQAMWERIYAFEPTGRGSTITIPRSREEPKEQK